MDLAIYRHWLQRTLMRPLTRLLRTGSLKVTRTDVVWQGPTRSRKVRMISATDASPYVKSLAHLRSLLATHPKVRATLLLLPVNLAHYRQHGLNGRQQQRLFEAVTRQAVGDVAQVVILGRLGDPGFFADQVHYTPAGRRILAREILRLTGR